MGMCLQKGIKITNYLVFLAIFGIVFSGCDAIDTILPSSGNYKVNILINDTPLDVISFVKSDDEIRPYFEESISEDKDVTALMVFLRNPIGDIVGNRIIYSLESEDAPQTEGARNEIIIIVKSLDGDLPVFPIPASLSMGRYTLVSQVMSGRDILQRTEKPFFYLSRTMFYYEGINVYLPGITDTSLLIPRGTVVMLEAILEYDSSLDPYIIWYDGRNKISEGNASDGAGYLFWQAPEQSGFFSLRAEIFPIDSFEIFAGYQKEVSLLVSSKTMDINLVSENIPQLIHWYIFDGNLNDSKMEDSPERALTIGKNVPVWMGADGTYGLAAGSNYEVKLPNVKFSNNGLETWQILFRYKHLNDGILFSAVFGSFRNVHIQLLQEGKSLILKLESPSASVSNSFKLPDIFPAPESDIAEEYSFITAGISFSIMPDPVLRQHSLTAQLNIVGDIIDNELAAKPITIKTAIGDGFQIILGSEAEIQADESDEELVSVSQNIKTTYTAIWDEFALYYMPPMDIIIAELSPQIDEDSQPNGDTN